MSAASVEPEKPADHWIRTTVMDAADIRRALTRIAHEIVERNRGGQDLHLLGIHRKGVPLANRLSQILESIEGLSVPAAGLDVSLYRDDFATRRPAVHASEIPFDVTGCRIILVDEVLYTGRTVRAALDALTDLGRAGSVQLAVLVDRGHRELPIRPDYVGKNIPTSAREWVDVRLLEFEGEDQVHIVKRASEDSP